MPGHAFLAAGDRWGLLALAAGGACKCAYLDAASAAEAEDGRGGEAEDGRAAEEEETVGNLILPGMLGLFGFFSEDWFA